MEYLYQCIISQEVNLIGAVFKLALSLLLGAAIGMERGRKGHVAGMRTFALISMGATLAMLVSIYIPQEYMGLKNGDPGRIAAQVVSGIGFLGAGAIIQQKGAVKGLTTAAGIWVTAALGLAVGAGMYVVPTAAVVLILFMLSIAERYEINRFRSDDGKIIRLKSAVIIEDVKPFRDAIEAAGIHVVDVFIRYDYSKEYTIVNFIILTKGHPDYMELFRVLRTCGEEIRSITLTNEVNN